jgi:PTS system mannose-specific IIA component
MPRVGGVIITHGQLATELLHAAEMIVGDIRHVRAVSIDWHDDVDVARQVIERAIAEADQGCGVLILTDLFGGTPTNLVMAYSGAGAGRNRYRRQPADGYQAGDGTF